jgi:endonuclease/exonuclease/phosphatase family metal-dependent hydrolase
MSAPRIKWHPNVLTAVLLSCLMLTGCAGRGSTQQTEGPLTLRVMAYNVHHCGGMDGVVDVERIANIIKASNADLVALQEVDKDVPRSGNVDQAAELGRLTGMYARFGKAIDYAGGEYGQAILSRWPIDEFEVVMLPSEPDREQRIALAATIRGDGKRPEILFVGAHLDHQGEQLRLPQMEALLQFLRDSRIKEQFVCGDMNAQPTSQTMQMAFEYLTDTTGDDALTLPAPNPNRKIDYIMFPKTQQWRVVHTEVLDEPVASDHRPVLAVLELNR